MAEKRRIDTPGGVQEIKQHGTPLFHFNIYPCTIPRDFPTVPLHWHRSMEIVYIKKGLGAVQYGLESRAAAAGDILILPPGTLHAFFEIPGSSMEYENIIFDVDFLGGGSTDVCDQEYLVPLIAGRLLGPVYLTAEDEAYADICSCLQDAETLCNFRRRGYELGVKAAMMRLLYLLMLHYPQPPEVETPDTERLKKVVALIEERYAEPLTVASVAQDCGYSSSHFMRWFKQMTGSSFVAYLIGRRLTFAAEALCESDGKILSIAQSVGFNNLSNFNRQFKARYRMTPREYRAASKPRSGGVGEK